MGVVNPRGQWHQLAAGLLLGFGSLAVVATIVLAAHVRRLDPNLAVGTFLVKLAEAAATAVSVSLLEELLFRGAIFGAFRKVWDWRAALLLSSLLYAILHFLAPAEIAGPIRWTSGLELLPRKLSGFGDRHVLVPAIFSLTLAGVMLGLAYQRSGNLYFSVGLHAGWIFWLRCYDLLTSPLATAHPAFWGTQKLLDGWLALPVLVCALAVFARRRFGDKSET